LFSIQKFDFELQEICDTASFPSVSKVWDFSYKVELYIEGQYMISITL